MFTIPDFGPSDLLTNPVENLRRIKTSSRSSIDDASINGAAQSISQLVTIANGESAGFNLYTTGETLLQMVACDGLDATVYSEFCTGAITSTGKSRSLKIGSVLDYSVFYNYIDNPTVNNDTSLNAARGAFDPSVTFGASNECSIVIKNNSGVDYAGSFAAIFDVFVPPSSTYWLQADTNLISTSEMSNYG